MPAMVHQLTISAPRVELGPTTMAKGVEAFLEFQDGFDDDDCAQTISEIKVWDLCAPKLSC
jgi:hypothetical protein